MSFADDLRAWVASELGGSSRGNVSNNIQRLLRGADTYGLSPITREGYPPEFLEAYPPTTEDTEDHVGNYLIEHGLFVSSGGAQYSVKLCESLQVFYAGLGDFVCTFETTEKDHFFDDPTVTGECSLGVRSLSWVTPVPSGTDHPPLQKDDVIQAWLEDDLLAPSLHTGLARWAAQACNCIIPISDYKPPGWPTYNPKWYGVARIREVGVSLSYWLIYAGTTGVRAAELSIDQLVLSAVVAVRDQAVDGIGITPDVERRYESLIFPKLTITENTVLLSSDTTPFDGGYSPLAHGIKWSDDGLNGRIVLLSSTYPKTAKVWTLAIDTADDGGRQVPTGATWSSVASGSFNPRTTLTNLYTSANGVPSAVHSTVGDDTGNGVAVYAMTYDGDTVTYSATNTIPTITPSNEIYRPGFYGEGNDSKNYITAAGGYSSNGFMVGSIELGYVASSISKTELRMFFQTREPVPREKSGRADLEDAWFDGFPSTSEYEGSVYEWEQGYLRSEEDTTTSQTAEKITTIIIPDSDAEALYLADYESASNEQKTSWYQLPSIKAAFSLVIQTPEDLCVGDDPASDCEPSPTGFTGYLWQETTGWHERPPEWSDGRSRMSRELYSIGPHLSNCTICKPVYGNYEIGNLQGGLGSGSDKYPGSTTNSNKDDVENAQSFLLTRYKTIPLSTDTTAWENALLGLPFTTPFALVSAGGDSIVYQDSLGGALQSTGGEDLQAAPVVSLRHIGVV